MRIVSVIRIFEDTVIQVDGWKVHEIAIDDCSAGYIVEKCLQDIHYFVLSPAMEYFIFPLQLSFHCMS